MSRSLPPAALVSTADVAPTGSGVLDGLTFVVKDVIDLIGHRTGMGNPTWLAAAPVAQRSARVVEQLLGAGARCVGKAVTDELAFSVSGVNVHDGAPPNPWAVDRTAGGSSSGPASAVAFGGVPFAIGTDTAGSIRVPASYCGLVGVRPTHGAIDPTGVVPLAQSFDTVGWLAQEARVARRVGEVLLSEGHTVAEPIAELVVLADAFSVAAPDAAGPLGRVALRLAELLDLPIRTATVDPSCLPDALCTFRTIQGAEAWANDGSWAEAHPGALAPDIERRLRAAGAIDPSAIDEALARRQGLVDLLARLVGPSGALVLPSTPGWAPLLTELAGPGADDIRDRVLQLTCLASLWGAPALSLPVHCGARLPLGLGLVAAPGRDLSLLDLATRCEDAGLLGRAPGAS